MHFLRILIGSVHCLRLLLLVRLITLVLVLRHSIENCSKLQVTSNYQQIDLLIINPLGDVKHAISLPLDKPFYLYTLSSAGCQNVKGATLKEESVNFDKKDGRYEINTEGENPFRIDKNRSQMKITYCYYTPGKLRRCFNLINSVSMRNEKR